MSDPNDKSPEELALEGQTIREVMAAVRVAQQGEMHEEALQERKRRRKVKEKRVQERQERHKKQAQAAKTRRQSVLNEANGKMANHIAVASRELRAAFRDATAIALPRHSQEGREQVRIRRSIEGALSALRQIGRGTFHVSDVDLDDVGT